MVYYIIMPYKVWKVKNQDCYKVYNVKTKRVFAKCTDKKNATKQLRLLRALEFNPAFSAKLRRSRSGSTSKSSSRSASRKNRTIIG